MTSLVETARAFLAIGGRVWIDPYNHVGAILDADSIFSLDLDEHESERRQRVGRTFLSARAADPTGVATLVREYGQRHGRFVVWQEA